MKKAELDKIIDYQILMQKIEYSFFTHSYLLHLFQLQRNRLLNI